MLPTAAAFLLVIGILVATAASVALTANSQAGRDQKVKQALAAADSGVRAASYRINVLAPGPAQCVGKSPSTGDLTLEGLAGDGWCGEQTEDLGNGATFSYRVSGPQDVVLNGQDLTQRKIASTGIVGGVKRRVLSVINAATGAPLFVTGNALISDEQIDLSNSARINGSAASNGDVHLTNSSTICGNATPGPGKQLVTQNASGLCQGFSGQAATTPLTLGPVDQGNAPTSNDNARIGVQDTWTSSGQIDWSPATRVLRLRNNSTLTLGGNVYSFCRLEIVNSAKLIIAARSPGTAVRIYVDAPESCSGSGAGSVRLANSGSIVNLNPSPTALQLYVVGSDSTATSVDLMNGAVLSLVIYAPRSLVTLSNSTQVVGAVAAKRATLTNSSTITWRSEVGELRTSSLLSIFRRQRWVECVSQPPGSAPDSGC